MKVESESWVNFDWNLICRNIFKAEVKAKVDLTFGLSAAIDLDAKTDLNASND